MASTEASAEASTHTAFILASSDKVNKMEEHRLRKPERIMKLLLLLVVLLLLLLVVLLLLWVFLVVLVSELVLLLLLLLLFELAFSRTCKNEVIFRFY